MLESLQLPMQFDSTLLHRDLEEIGDTEWIPHFNTRDYNGSWRVVALRGPAGAVHPVQAIYSDPTTTKFTDTELLSRCPYFKQVLSRFQCPLKSVRLLNLQPGSVIKEHTDYNLGFEDGEVRIHVPVLTNQDVEFFLAGKCIMMQEGESWYLNVNLPHRVANRSSTDRVHLILDCVVNDWMRIFFQESVPEN